MPNSNIISIREFRSSPFAWQSKIALRLIRTKVTRREIAGVISTYVALAEIASDRGYDEIDIYIYDVARYSGLSEKTTSKHLDTLNSLQLIHRPPQVKSSDGKFQACPIKLLDLDPTAGNFEESSLTKVPIIRIYKKDNNNTNVLGSKEPDVKLEVNEETKTEAKPTSYGNEIVNRFRQLLKDDLGLTPTGSSDLAERRDYWNALQHLGVRAGMKSREDLTAEIKLNIENFLGWLKRDISAKNYEIQKSGTIRQKAKFFKENKSKFKF